MPSSPIDTTHLPTGPHAPTTLRRDLRASLADGVAFSLMVGAGETYFPALVLALGHGEVAAGLIATLPPVAGALLQLSGPMAVERLGSHRRWVVLAATVQAASFVPLALLALLGRGPLWMPFLLASVYWGFGMATGPAWNTWVGRLVPRRLRARFFARRTRFAQAGALAGLVGGGLLLHGAHDKHAALPRFALLFLLAGASRAFSSRMLARQSQPRLPRARERSVPLGLLLRRLVQPRGDRLLVYLLGIQVSAQLAGPYFTPYMLEQLRMPYARYVALIATAFVARTIMLPLLGELAHRRGARLVLRAGGLGIVPVSALWLVADNYWYLLALQLVAGTVWAAHELAMMLLFLEAIPERERTSVLTTFNVANALALAGGSLCGAALLRALDESRTAYHTLFAASSAARLLVVLAMWRMPLPELRVPALALRVLALRPSVGSLDRPILPSSLLPTELRRMRALRRRRGRRRRLRRRGRPRESTSPTPGG